MRSRYPAVAESEGGWLRRDKFPRAKLKIVNTAGVSQWKFMIIAVMSDTHGHLTEMRQASARMMSEFAADVIIHLGDNSTDADELMGGLSDLITVPGVFEERYQDENIPNRIIKEFEGVPFLLTHTPTRDAHDHPDDIDPTEAAQDGDAKVVLYGHTHQASVAEKHGAIYINPGHLNPKDARGEAPSFAVVEVSPPKLRVRIIELAGGVREDKLFFI